MRILLHEGAAMTGGPTAELELPCGPKARRNAHIRFSPEYFSTKPGATMTHPDQIELGAIRAFQCLFRQGYLRKLHRTLILLHVATDILGVFLRRAGCKNGAGLLEGLHHIRAFDGLLDSS